MHPAYSVILFTTASGAGYGLLALLGITGMSHGQASSLAFGMTAMIISIGLITLGLLSSTFHLGRQAAGEDAIAMIEVDQPIPDDVLAKVRALPHVVLAKALRF